MLNHDESEYKHMISDVNSKPNMHLLIWGLRPKNISVIIYIHQK